MRRAAITDCVKYVNSLCLAMCDRVRHYAQLCAVCTRLRESSSVSLLIRR